MLRGIYGAATGLEMADRNQEVIAQNLAHATVPGYRRIGLAQESFANALSSASRSSNEPSVFGAQQSRFYTDFRQGALVATGSPLDFALSGDGFFSVQGDGGATVYTRDGAFVRASDGTLVTRGGQAVLSENGPVRIPPEASDIRVTAEGVIRADGAEIGRLRIASFENPQALERAGTTGFIAPANATPQPSNAVVRQNYREAANVEPATEMIGLIRGSRYFEAAQRALRSLSESIQLSTKPQ